MRKFLIVGEMRKLEKQVNLSEISYSRMIEIINEKAEEYATLKLQEQAKEIERLKALFGKYLSEQMNDEDEMTQEEWNELEKIQKEYKPIN
jgi:hypothetical protein